MSKCIFCGKEDAGVICKHCLSKKASGVGKAIKIGGKLAMQIVPVAAAVVSRGKIKFKK